MPDDNGADGILTVKKNPNLDGALHIPYAGEKGINKECPIIFWLTPEEPDGTENEILIEVAEVAYDMYADIAIQIQGNTTTYDFKLRVVFPQAPFNALGRSGYQFVYPGDEIVVNNPAYFSFDVCGKTPQKVFATGLNEGTNSETTPLGFCDRPHQTVREATTIWDEGLKLISLRPWGLIEAERFFGAKMKITTPKGSFTVSFVKEETE